MNYWTQLSIEYANQRSYLDDLFQVYPTIPEGIRDIEKNIWKDVEKAFKKRDNFELIKNLLKLHLFPIKDSYVAYLKRDSSAIERNPATVDRLCGRVYEMGLDNIFAREHLNYRRDKGLDFIGRFNGKYIIGEAKFLTDFGGHQNAQYNDAIATLKAKNAKAITIAILDGVLYIKGNNKMYKELTTRLKNYNIMSSLVLRDFLYQV